MTWTRRFHAVLADNATGGVYVDLIADDEEQRVPVAYGLNHDRLQALKVRWDPQNLFRHNYHAPPTAGR